MVKINFPTVIFVGLSFISTFLPLFYLSTVSLAIVPYFHSHHEKTSAISFFSHIFPFSFVPPIHPSGSPSNNQNISHLPLYPTLPYAYPLPQHHTVISSYAFHLNQTTSLFPNVISLTFQITPPSATIVTTISNSKLSTSILAPSNLKSQAPPLAPYNSFIFQHDHSSTRPSSPLIRPHDILRLLMYCPYNSLSTRLSIRRIKRMLRHLFAHALRSPSFRLHYLLFLLRHNRLFGCHHWLDSDPDFLQHRDPSPPPPPPSPSPSITPHTTSTNHFPVATQQRSAPFTFTQFIPAPLFGPQYSSDNSGDGPFYPRKTFLPPLTSRSHQTVEKPPSPDDILANSIFLPTVPLSHTDKSKTPGSLQNFRFIRNHLIDYIKKYKKILGWQSSICKLLNIGQAGHNFIAPIRLQLQLIAWATFKSNSIDVPRSDMKPSGFFRLPPTFQNLPSSFDLNNIIGHSKDNFIRIQLYLNNGDRQIDSLLFSYLLSGNSEIIKNIIEQNIVRFSFRIQYDNANYYKTAPNGFCFFLAERQLFYRSTSRTDSSTMFTDDVPPDLDLNTAHGRQQLEMFLSDFGPSNHPAVEAVKDYLTQHPVSSTTNIHLPKNLWANVCDLKKSFDSSYSRSFFQDNETHPGYCQLLSSSASNKTDYFTFAEIHKTLSDNNPAVLSSHHCFLLPRHDNLLNRLDEAIDSLIANLINHPFCNPSNTAISPPSKSFHRVPTTIDLDDKSTGDPPSNNDDPDSLAKDSESASSPSSPIDPHLVPLSPLSISAYQPVLSQPLPSSFPFSFCSSLEFSPPSSPRIQNPDQIDNGNQHPAPTTTNHHSLIDNDKTIIPNLPSLNPTHTFQYLPHSKTFSIDDLLSSNRHQLLRHIPKSFQASFQCEATKLLRRVNSLHLKPTDTKDSLALAESTSALVEFLVFPTVFQKYLSTFSSIGSTPGQPRRTRTSNNRSHHRSPPSTNIDTAIASKPSPRQVQKTLLIASKQASNGALSNAVHTLECLVKEEFPTSLDDPDVKEEFISLHPQRSELLLPTYPCQCSNAAPQPAELTQATTPDPTNDATRIPLCFDEKTVARTLPTCKRGSATAFSPWTFEVIKIACSDRDFLFEATKFINLIANCKMEKGFWNVNRSIAIRKANGKIRPISIADPWIRLTCRLIAGSTIPTVKDPFNTIQFGIGIKKGLEIMIHNQQFLWDSNHPTPGNTDPQDESDPVAPNPSPHAGTPIPNISGPPSHPQPTSPVHLTIDIKNAFNSISRSAILAGIREYCPILEEFFLWQHDTPTALLDSSGHFITHCTTGVIQGNPLSGLYFCLGLHRCLIDTQRAHQNVSISAYYDDIIITGPEEDVSSCFQTLSHALLNINLEINVDKCKWTRLNDNGFIFGGTPIGSENYRKTSIEKLFSDFTAILPLLSLLSAKNNLKLLTYCVNTRPIYFIRNTAPHINLTASTTFDNNISDNLTTLLKKPNLDHLQQQLRHLPLRLGGLGIHSMTITAPSAFAASRNYALVYLYNNLPAPARAHLPPPDFLPLIKDRIPAQKDLMSTVNTAIVNDIVNDLSLNNREPHKALFLSQSSSEASHWIKSVFNLHTNTKYPNQKKLEIAEDDIPLAVSLRLLYPTAPSDCSLYCPCGRSTSDDSDPFHGLHCNNCGGLINRRHNKIRDLLAKYIKACNPSASVYIEQSIPSNKGLSTLRTDILVKYSDTSFDYIDVSIANPAAPTYRNKDALQVRTREKFRKAKRLLHDDQAQRMVPFIIDVSGKAGTHALEFIERTAGYVPGNLKPDLHLNQLRKQLLRDINIILTTENCAIIRQYVNQLSEINPNR